MHGVVEVIYSDGRESFSEINMLMDNAGELFADIMTVSPSLSAIPSASAILDASNYTVQAWTFGKDASGYYNHAHVSAFNAVGDGVIRAVSYYPTTISSYQSSSAPYLLLPEYPSPLNIRLESKSTMCQYGRYVSELVGLVPLDTDPLKYDSGHNLNMWVAASQPGNVMGAASSMGGCYPAPQGSKWYLLYSTTAVNTPICSGTFKGVYNSHSAIDISGFINITVTGAAMGNRLNTASLISGAIVITEGGASTFSSTGRVIYKTQVSGGDFGSLAFYGGIYQMGLWYIDMKSLLSSGSRPPYSFSILNNARRYKLFAKKTFNRDLTYIQDTALLGGVSGHRYMSGLEAVQPPAMVINWYINLL